MTTKMNEKVLSNLLYWVQERHSVYQKKLRKEPRPWTEDRVLQKYAFVNVFRELDRTTQWFRQCVRHTLRDDDAVLMATVIFRRFNYVPTGILLNSLMVHWDSEKAIAALSGQSKIFTDAYRTPSKKGDSKLESICKLLDDMWVQRDLYVNEVKRATTLEAAWQALRGPHYDGMLPYEVVSDLRHTHFLHDATDVDTWGYFGPGAQRGCGMLLGRESPDQAACLEVGRYVHFLLNDYFHSCNRSKFEWERQIARIEKRSLFEMRDVIHCISGLDNYLRVAYGKGKGRLYHG